VIEGDFTIKGVVEPHAAFNIAFGLTSQSPLELVKKVRKSHALMISAEGKKDAEGAEASIILVPTPSLPDGSFSIEHVLSAIRTIGRLIRGRGDPHTVLLVSTVSPGSTGGPIRRVLECAARRHVVPGQLDLIYCPEFVQLGNVLYGMRRPFAFLVGVQAHDVSLGVFKQLLVNDVQLKLNEKPPFHIMTWEEAYGANVDTVTDFIGSDPRIGPKLLRAGLHPGGPCLPRDIRALENAGANVDSVALPIAIDRMSRQEIVRWVEFLETLAMRHFGWHSPRDVGILGENYKPGVLVREEAFGTRLWQTLYGHDCLMIPSCDSTRNSNGEVGKTIRAASIVILTLMDPALKEILAWKAVWT
jgi:UDPglucose 6-dehydrogenase